MQGSNALVHYLGLYHPPLTAAISVSNAYDLRASRLWALAGVDISADDCV